MLIDGAPQPFATDKLSYPVFVCSFSHVYFRHEPTDHVIRLKQAVSRVAYYKQ